MAASLAGDGSRGRDSLQLQQLKNRGMAADGPERAIDYLRRIGCYRLSGYWFALRKRSDPLVLLDENGKKPKSVRVETLQRIEVAIRVEISHTLCLPQARTAVRGFCSQLESGYMPHAAAPVVWQASAVGRARARNSSNTTRLSTDCRWRCGLLAKLGTLVRCPRFTAACACRGRTGSPTTLA